MGSAAAEPQVSTDSETAPANILATDNSPFDDPTLIEALSQAVSRVNRNVANVEKVRRFCIAPEAFTVENGMLTPTLKIRRHVIRETYKDMLEKLYE